MNRLQEALEGTRDRESHLAERVAASVADGHRSPHAFLHSFERCDAQGAILVPTNDNQPIASIASLVRLNRSGAVAGALASESKSLAQSNKSRDH
jgi:hypothetical protein